ncbi:MAG TPA: phosphopentomutase [Thermoanaerobaculia bacterium]|nr:phosphopentomutase [Thermoanaerobaculia bacterium]
MSERVGGSARRRILIVVCDGLGVGAAPDADAYGDAGTDTLGHVLDRIPTALPNLESLGLLALLDPSRGGRAAGARGKAYELSAGKDTTTGHWEMMGLVVERPFPLYPRGFPPQILGPFERYLGKQVLGNRAASGTEIIQELGEEHQATGRPLLYTSGDSVFQIAAHEEVWPPERLWEVCRFARSILVGDHAVGRVIARPFVGKPGAFVRTANRRDYSVEPIGETWLDRLVAAGRHVFGVGKIADIFSGRGITSSVHTGSDAEGVRVSVEALRSGDADVVFTNLVDFDSKYGHRNDPAGFAKNLASFDALLPEVIAELGRDDLFFLTADHGCETTDVSTDHTREHVPFLSAGPAVRGDADLGIRAGFADLAATAGEWLGVPAPRGKSALSEILA